MENHLQDIGANRLRVVRTGLPTKRRRYSSEKAAQSESMKLLTRLWSGTPVNPALADLGVALGVKEYLLDAFYN